MRTQSTSSEQSRGSPPPTFAIVGVGASAGGLDAFRQLLAHVPDQSGLAFVLVQHLEATRASQLSDALATATTMRVAQAEDGVRVEPDRVYVIPPGTQMAIEGGVLRLSPLGGDERRPTLPIDYFLRSLAADRGRQAIGVVLSGNASDGTAGLSAIRENGGITFAQDPRSARVGAMPRSAIDAGVVDFCLPLPAIGAELVPADPPPVPGAGRTGAADPGRRRLPGRGLRHRADEHRRRLRGAQAGDVQAAPRPADGGAEGEGPGRLPGTPPRGSGRDPRSSTRTCSSRSRRSSGTQTASRS